MRTLEQASFWWETWWPSSFYWRECRSGGNKLSNVRSFITAFCDRARTERRQKKTKLLWIFSGENSVMKHSAASIFWQNAKELSIISRTCSRSRPRIYDSKTDYLEIPFTLWFSLKWKLWFRDNSHHNNYYNQQDNNHQHSYKDKTKEAPSIKCLTRKPSGRGYSNVG